MGTCQKLHRKHSFYVELYIILYITLYKDCGVLPSHLVASDVHNLFYYRELALRNDLAL